MIIKRLTMHNFGVYASTNEFEFIGEKPIVLIGGLNGRGKTTFLEAVLLALYGANSFAYQESSFTTYGQYLRSYVNCSDGTKETYVELEFQMNNAEKDCYIVRRDWDACNKIRTSERIQVSKNGKHSEFLTQNWVMFIENILPSALSNFFFFDGEKIAELAVDSTNEQLKESIRAMLGISVLDTLESDIGRNVRKIQKEIRQTEENKYVEYLRNVKDLKEKSLIEIDEDIEETTDLLQTYTDLCEKKKNQYAANGGDVVEKRTQLLEKRAQISSDKQHNKDNMQQLAASELPLSLVSDLLLDVFEQGTKEQENFQKKQSAEYITRLYESFLTLNEKSTAVQKFVDYVTETASENKVESVYNLSDNGLYQVTQLVDSSLNKSVSVAKEAIDKQNLINNEANQIESYLAIDIDENEVRKLYKEIREYEQKILDCEARLSVLQQNRGNANGELMKATSEFNHHVSALLDNMEANDDNERLVKYSEMALKVLNEYSIRLQKAKTGKLAETITLCYKKLANKKNLIDCITMNPVTLDLDYLDKNGDIVEKTALSAGEKQLMVISILWALAICSKKKLPVIIDTPLSRLDSNHRKSLIKIYFPQASEQTIILSTDSEIDKDYYRLIRKNVGDEFTLIYDDETRTTTIHKGYFAGEYQ